MTSSPLQLFTISVLTYRYIIYTIRSSHAERVAGIVAIIPSIIASNILETACEIQTLDNKKYLSTEKKTKGDSI